MRLTMLFLLITIGSVLFIDNTMKEEKPRWGETEYIRIEGKNCPLFFPRSEQ